MSLAAVPTVRERAERWFAAELTALSAADDRPRPPNWRLSPAAVRTYLMGGKLPDGTVITPKYIGSPRLIEVAIATLATDRALLLTGLPGTAKSWVSEHLAAAITGDSSLLVQGTAGTDEAQVRYGWNYARLLNEGPSRAALVPSPVLRAMESGALVRIEELTRISVEVQDALLTPLSEKVMPVPELAMEVAARRGFNLIATANDRDKGVNEPSAALLRRFHTVILPPAGSLEEEVRIVSLQIERLGQTVPMGHATAEQPIQAVIERVVTIFRELRSGLTLDGRTRLKSPTSTLSVAEAIAVVSSGLAMAAHFGDGVVRASDLASGLVGAVVRDPARDEAAWQEYVQTVVREREGWKDLYRALRELD